jgi:hypothetical protein
LAALMVGFCWSVAYSSDLKAILQINLPAFST